MIRINLPLDAGPQYALLTNEEHDAQLAREGFLSYAADQARLVALGKLDPFSAVDHLQNEAGSTGLVELLGRIAVFELIAAAFRPHWKVGHA